MTGRVEKTGVESQPSTGSWWKNMTDRQREEELLLQMSLHMS